MEDVERFDGDAEVVALLGARLGDAGAGGGEGLLFGGGDGVDGILAAEFHK